MTGLFPPRLDRRQYEEALRLFHDGKFEECIKAAKYNLNDGTLPGYYIIKNCILVASALDEWEDADIYRLTAEQAYRTGYKVAREKEDKNSLEALKGLRKELDQLNAFRDEDMEERMAAILDDIAAEEEEENEEDMYDFEDAQAVAQAENEVELAAEIFVLPLRSTSDAVAAVQIHPTGTGESKPEGPIKQLREEWDKHEGE